MKRGPDLYRLERRLLAAGLAPVAGADEAGRGACAGPLVAGAVILDDNPRHRIRGLNDSKLLTERVREALYEEVVERAVAWSVIIVESDECDRVGIQEANIAALRRALLRLDVAPAYALTDGFPVRGIGVPGLAVWKGDRVAASVAAASIVAKVTRDRIMVAAHDRWPAYGFAAHKGYSTPEHQAALDALGPCPIHRRSYVNVARAARVEEP